MKMTATYAPSLFMGNAKRPKRNFAALALVVLVSLALSIAALPHMEQRLMEGRLRQDEATLRLVTEVVRGALSRTEALPALIAERPILRDILRDPDNSGLLPFANEQLRQTALSLGISDIYVMDADGTTIAASNYRLDRSFIGQNFRFRPYFIDALANGIGRYHALGTTSGQRGYYFAAPIFDSTKILGVVAVKITLDRFEAAWRDNDSRIFVADQHGVIFMSDRPEWQFRTLAPLSEVAMEEIRSTRQYPMTLLKPLALRREPFIATRGEDSRLSRMTITSDDGVVSHYVAQQSLIATARWRVNILTPAGSTRAEALGLFAISWLIILIAGLSIIILMQRRTQLLERIAVQRELAETLDARVQERTRDLNNANAKLRQEIEERARTEERLRRTQAELVQAGKLAALGQMSAALSHEFNQPLAAVKSYAENAATFLERNRAEEARENITRISLMADRMASISKHLRNFARRPQEQLRDIPLRAVIRDALDLIEPRLRRAGMEVILDLPSGDDEIWVIGGRVRLQQVLVNLLSNALDAMVDTKTPKLELSITEGVEGMVCLTLRDNGTGLSQDAQTQVFDPFFTTKEPGHGLGLGLSISYNIIRDFGGKIEARNTDAGGAEFTLHLRPSTKTRQQTSKAEHHI